MAPMPEPVPETEDVMIFVPQSLVADVQWWLRERGCHLYQVAERDYGMGRLITYGIGDD